MTKYRLYEITCELKTRPETMSDIIDAVDGSDWDLISEHDTEQAAEKALDLRRPVADVDLTRQAHGPYYWCRAAFVVECDISKDEDGDEIFEFIGTGKASEIPPAPDTDNE